MIAKRFKLDDFDSEVEMWELMNTQAEIISDLEKENEQLKDIIKDIVVQLDANHTFHTYHIFNGLLSNLAQSTLLILCLISLC